MIILATMGEWNAIVSALGWTLFHSIWQAAIICSLVYWFSRMTSSAEKKYIAGMAGIFLLPVIGIFTFFLLYQPAPALEIQPQAAVVYAEGIQMAAGGEVVTEGGTTGNLLQQVDRAIPYLVTIWAVGFILLLSKWLAGLWYLNRLRNWSRPLQSELWNEVRYKLDQKFGLNGKYSLRTSDRIFSPILLGLYRPVVLIPIGLVNGLTEDEVEAILAHELAHLARRDFLFNLIQTFIETLYYFNPFVILLGRWISKEREHCCDDSAVQAMREPLVYARSLLSIEKQCSQSFQLEMAPGLWGRSGTLSKRIERILFKSNSKHTIMVRSLSALVGLLLVVIFLVAADLPDLTKSGEAKEYNVGHSLTEWAETGETFDVEIQAFTDEITQESEHREAETGNLENASTDSHSPFTKDSLPVKESEEKPQPLSDTKTGEPYLDKTLESISQMTENLEVVLRKFAEGKLELDELIHEAATLRINSRELDKNTVAEMDEEEIEEFRRELREGMKEAETQVAEAKENLEKAKFTMSGKNFTMTLKDGKRDTTYSLDFGDIMETVRYELGKIDWEEIGDQIRTSVAMAESETRFAMQKWDFDSLVVRADTVIVVDPNTYEETLLFGGYTGLSFSVNDKERHMDFYATAKNVRKSELEELAGEFSGDIINMGLIGKETTSVELNERELKVDGHSRSASEHRQLWSKYQSKLGGLYRIKLDLR